MKVHRVVLFADFFLSSFSDKSIASTAIRIFVASLFLWALEASDLINNGIAYAQQMQDSGSSNSASTMRATSSAGTFEIVLDIDPFPIEPERPTMLNLTFIRMAEPAVIQLNIGYNVFILDENDNVIFRASNTTGQEEDLLHSVNGTALVPYRFESTGYYTVHVKVPQVNFVPIHQEFVAFLITVVPEFGRLYMTAISASALAIGVAMFKCKN